MVIFLQSCGSFASPPPPTIAPPATATLVLNSTPFPAAETIPPTITSTPVPKIERVLIVSFDGLRPDAIIEANMVNVMALMQNGAYTLNAQVAAGSATINVRNVTAGSLSEAIVIRYTVIKSISA